MAILELDHSVGVGNDRADEPRAGLLEHKPKLEGQIRDRGRPALQPETREHIAAIPVIAHRTRLTVVADPAGAPLRRRPERAARQGGVAGTTTRGTVRRQNRSRERRVRMSEQPGLRVDLDIVGTEDAEVQVRADTRAGVTDVADDLAAPDNIADPQAQ